MRRRIVFAGTPGFGLGCLEALAQSHDICAVYTQPDRPSGRGQKVQFSPIKSWAIAHNIPVYQPENFKKPETIEALSALNPEVMVVIAYGLILPKKVLAIPRLGCINVHASILPQWRGAAPIQYAILNQDAASGVSIMQMDAGMDTGPVYDIARCALAPDETAASLHDKLGALAIAPLLKTLEQLGDDHFCPIPQQHEQATYAGKIDKSMALIHWDQASSVIDAQVRALTPWPVAFTHAGSALLKVHAAHPVKLSHQRAPGTILAIERQGLLVATSDGALSIQKLQFPGGKVLAVNDWVNAQKQTLSVGMVLE